MGFYSYLFTKEVLYSYLNFAKHLKKIRIVSRFWKKSQIWPKLAIFIGSIGSQLAKNKTSYKTWKLWFILGQLPNMLWIGGLVQVFIKQKDLKGKTFQISFGWLEIWVFHFHFRHSDELTQIPDGMVSTVLTYLLWRGDQGLTLETIQSLFCKLILM